MKIPITASPFALIWPIILSLLLTVCCPAPYLFAQKDKNRNIGNIIIRDFNPTDSSTVLIAPKIKFDNIHILPYYSNPGKLAQIRKYRLNKQWEELYKSLYEYVSNFGIQNFVREMDLVWQLARAAEYFGDKELTKDMFRLILKHHRGDLQKAILFYDSITRFEKDLYVDLDYYYALVERRKAIDTLRPPEGVLLNMGESVNSSFDDYGLTIAGQADNIILFTSKRNQDTTRVSNALGSARFNEDIFISEKDSYGDWLPARTFEELNSRYNEGSPCMSQDGKTIIFVRCHSPEGFGDCDLFIVEKKLDGKWGEPRNMGLGINSYSWDSHPSLSVTGDTLFFTSDRRGGFGGADIYFAVKDKKGKWGNAMNIGPIINTRNSEVSPFMHPKYNVLYFSSDGHIVNFGRFDIFKSFLIDGDWGEPKNIGPLVNGVGDEFYFSIDSKAKWLFYARSEQPSDENLDLHSFPLPMEAKPNNTVRFSGVVKEPVTGEVFKGVVTILDMTDGVEVAPKYLRADGTFEFELINQKKYLLLIEGDNFFNIREVFFVDGDMEVNIPAVSLNSAITFKSIDFESGSARLKPEMENNLHLVVDFLVQNPDYSVRVSGHTDSDGDPNFNQTLSQARADAIGKYILSYGGLEASRVSTVGYGSSRPLVVPERNASDKRINRRVEFKIYRTDIGLTEEPRPH